MGTILISGRAELDPYLDQVRAAADIERDAFGFLPRSAYEEFAAQGRMIVAADTRTRSLAGYVLYGGAMPQGRIFQTWTSRESRGQGIAQKLIAEVVRRLELYNYLSLRADVAEDLAVANRFYESVGFEMIKVRPGRTAGRRINIRVRELDTPSLIDLASARNDAQPRLPISLPQSPRLPLYVLDLNVIFDVAKARPRADFSEKVFGVGLESEARLAVSTEAIIELERNTDPSAPDPILRFVASLPRLPPPPREAHARLIHELGPLIFPERTRSDRLSVQDKSDLTHLATAIQESATGFITSEKAILRAGEHLRDRYQLEVISPEAFGMTLVPDQVETGSIDVRAGGSEVRARPLQDSDYEEIEAFLTRRGLTPSEARKTLAAGTVMSPRRRHLVWVDRGIVAIGAWDAPSAAGRARTLHLYVNEGHAAASVAAGYLLHQAISDVGPAPPAVYEMISKPGQPTVRQVALANGFFRIGSGRSQTQTLQKVALARAVLPQDWTAIRNSVRSRAGLTLPAEMPQFSDLREPLYVLDQNGASVSLPLSDLERLLSPLCLVLPGRPAVVLPITRRYAEELFSGSAQPELLGSQEAALRSIRGYIGGRGTYNAIPEGGLALFYESGRGGGRKAITALSRVTRKYLMAKESAASALTGRVVLEAETVRSLGSGNQVVVTEFEDLMRFRRPVPLSALRRIGCVDATNFVTARQIALEHAALIIRAGEPLA